MCRNSTKTATVFAVLISLKCLNLICTVFDTLQRHFVRAMK